MIFKKSTPLRGELAVPGDKSISHRAVMLGALAKGTTSVRCRKQRNYYPPFIRYFSRTGFLYYFNRRCFYSETSYDTNYYSPFPNGRQNRKSIRQRLCTAENNGASFKAHTLSFTGKLCTGEVLCFIGRNVCRWHHKSDRALSFPQPF